MNKSVRKALLLFVLVIVISFSASPALASVSAFVAKDGDGEYYQYDYKLLIDSYALTILDSPDGLYASFIEKEAYAVLTESGTYISYSDVLDHYASVMVNGGKFELEKYLLSKEAKRAEMPGSLKIVGLNSGNIEYSNITLDEDPGENNPEPGDEEPVDEPGDNNDNGNNPVKEYVIVDVSVLNLRSGPGTTHDIIDRLLLGTILEVTGEDKEWLKVLTPGGKSGWVHSDYVKKTELKSGDVLKGKVIVVDPGHGGADPGAIGYSGLQEKVVTLAVGKNLEALLTEAGAKVIMTRTGDQSVSNTKRVEMANKAEVDVYVSIHANAFTSPDSNGTETHYCEKNENSEASKFLAHQLQRELVSALGLRDRGVKKNSFFVLTNTEMPAALVELAFLTNPEEEELLRDAKTHKKSADALFKGLEAYFKFYR